MSRSWPSDQDASGRSFHGRELEYLQEVLASGQLNSTRGKFSARMEKAFADLIGAPAVSCASGTAAVHVAIAALDLEPGSEVITSPLTDFGGVAGILWQGCIPVFADVDPVSLNITAETVAARITPRTRAVIVTHLFGNPADVREILKVVDRLGIPVIEDCAQAYGATLDGRHVGAFGALACFSLQQTKHITTGEGGVVTANGAAFFERAHQFVNKARIYTDEIAEHHFLSLNYRMTELQAAVGAAQLERLPDLLAARRNAANALEAQLSGLEGLRLIKPLPGATQSFWRIALHIDEQIVDGGMARYAMALKDLGVLGVMPGYQRPAYEWKAVKEQRTFGTSRYPFTLADPEAVDYAPERFPGVQRARAGVLVLPWNERYGIQEVNDLAQRMADAYHELARNTNS
ncbi:DegT/DnrJ/EryC1/StrS family aminotransferase [Nocardia ignorata]|uniref:dTDP-4-amino-4,6-dideoxygalactose transaminase n=1 Tax=Nocardia ignorata TaxID=145285 RepID=A0A4R6PIY6_NOCIG|nr:DegT/DnrJ/EryC1/StrS family aminotransferase [Nocardia ignorata]TDP37696.1 dTDP-4-amino-4,6-dideoxygalactose transaminase [Nocardia ignorata]